MITQSLVRFFNTIGEVVKKLYFFNQEETKKNNRKSVHKQLDNLLNYADNLEGKFILNMDLTPETNGTIESVIIDSVNYIDSDFPKENEDGLSEDEQETGFYLAIKKMKCRKIAKLLNKNFETIRTRKQHLFEKTNCHDITSFTEYFKITYPNYLPPVR